MESNNLEELVIARTHQLKHMAELLDTLTTALQELRPTATDAQRAIIDKALAKVGIHH